MTVEDIHKFVKEQFNEYADVVLDGTEMLRTLDDDAKAGVLEHMDVTNIIVSAGMACAFCNVGRLFSDTYDWADFDRGERYYEREEEERCPIACALSDIIAMSKLVGRDNEG